MRLRIRTILLTFSDSFKSYWYNYSFILLTLGVSSLFINMLGINLLSFFCIIVFITLLFTARFTKLGTLVKYFFTVMSFILLMLPLFIHGMDFRIFSKVGVLILILYVFMIPGFISPVLIAIVLSIKILTFRGMIPIDGIIGNLFGLTIQAATYSIISLLLKRLFKDKENYREISITDSLTKISTLSNIISIGNKLIKQGHDITIFVFDLNNFKQFNDTYGYLTGNKILIQIADFLKEKAQKYKGWVGRLGGDEFILLVKDYTVKNIESLGNELYKEINSQLFEIYHDVEPINLSFSIGKASSIALSRPFNIEKLLYNADIDMYYNKFGKKRTTNKYVSHHDFFPYKLKQLLNVLAEKDMYTYVHSEYSAQYAAAFARKLDLPEETVAEIYKAGWLHDIGKILISKNILVKSDKLTEEEFSIIKNHITHGYNILKVLKVSPIIINGVLYHHEQWDGNGYNFNLKGIDIPLEARILKITDAFSAMIIKRAYSTLLSKKEALDELRMYSGIHFDPELIEVFIEMIKAEGNIFIYDTINKFLNLKNIKIGKINIAKSNI